MVTLEGLETRVKETIAPAIAKEVIEGYRELLEGVKTDKTPLELVKVSRIAKELDYSPKKLYRLIDEYNIKKYRIKDCYQYRINRLDVMKLIE